MNRLILVLAMSVGACGTEETAEPVLEPGAYDVRCFFDDPTKPTDGVWTLASTGSWYTVDIERIVVMGGTIAPGGHIVVAASVQGEGAPCEVVYMADITPHGDHFSAVMMQPVAECERAGLVLKAPCTGVHQ